MSDAPRTGPRQFRWYLGGHAAWFTSFGIQMILFPSLVAVVLQESAERVGSAQMAVMAPAMPAAAMAVVLTVLFRRSGLWGHTATSALSTPARS